MDQLERATVNCRRLEPLSVFLARANVASKCKTETEVKRAEIFELARVRIHTVVEANRADRQLVTQTPANRVAHITQPNILGGRQQIPSVSKHRALQFAENRECVFHVEDGKKFSTDRMTVIIVRAEFALAEAAYRCGSAVKKPFIDGNRNCLVGAAVGERMNNAAARAERD